MSRVIDLQGPQGNGIALMGIADDLLRQLGRRDESREMLDEMMSGDYGNLLKVFQSKFGSLVEFINNPEEEM